MLETGPGAPHSLMEPFLQIAPHSLAIVLSRTGAGEAAGVSESDELPRHHTGYEIFANFKAENSQLHVWNQRVSEAVSETFFLGWIDEHVLLIQGKEDHLEALREGWMRRCLNPPRGFTIKYLGKAQPAAAHLLSVCCLSGVCACVRGCTCELSGTACTLTAGSAASIQNLVWTSASLF